MEDMILVLVTRYSWPKAAATEQAVLWSRGIRDGRIADDTFKAYEYIKYGD